MARPRTQHVRTKGKSPAMRPRNTGVLLGVLAVMLLPACTDSTRTAEDRALPEPPGEPRKQRVEVPHTLEAVADLAATIDGKIDRRVSSCLASRGFPQLQEAEGLRRTGTGGASYQNLRIDPLDLGPYTLDQARTAGFVGTPDLFDDGGPAFVISNDKAYDQASDKCRAEAAASTAKDYEDLRASWTSFQDKLQNDFKHAVTAEVNRLLSERLTCTRDHGYPGIPVDPGQIGDFESFLDATGIPSGTRAPAVETPTRPSPGQVVVIPDEAPARYMPSQREVALAETYVSCGERIDFVDRLGALQEAPRKKVLGDTALQVTAFAEKFADAARSLDA